MSTMRKAGAVTALLAAAGSAVAIGSVQLASADSATAKSGVNIRSGPGTKYDIVGGLTAGQRITAVGKPENGWIKVRFNGSTAYVSADYLDLNPNDKSPGPANIYTKGTKIATAPLNVRTSPNLGSKVIGYIAEGQNVTLTGKQSRGFAEMLYGGQRAWVTAQYLVSSMHGLPKHTGARYATTDLLVRTSTDSDFGIITTVKKGAKLAATGTTRDGFAQIIYHDAYRWVTAKYLSEHPVAGAKPSDPGKSSGDSSKGDSSSKPDRSNYKPAPMPKPKLPTPSLPKIIGTRYATTELTIRSAPGAEFTAITDVPTGTKLSITGKITNGKAQVIYGNAARWVTAKYLSTSKPQKETPKPALPTVVGTRYATTELILRSNPTSDYKSYGDIPAGTKVNITATEKNGRTEIVYKNAIRWVTSEYLSKSKPGTSDGGGDGGSGAISSSKKGLIALAYAKAQLGKPYVFAAEGPDAFDCSGLVQTAWKQAGVSLPRLTYDQYDASPHVSLDHLRLGDLVFFYGPNPEHVGIYAGNGQVIHAPRPGKTVEYSPISWMPVVGATRPG